MKRINRAEKISITLTPEMLKIIREILKDGAYTSTSEVICEAIRIRQRQEEHHARIASILERLEQSAHSGKTSNLVEGHAIDLNSSM